MCDANPVLVSLDAQSVQIRANHTLLQVAVVKLPQSPRHLAALVVANHQLSLHFSGQLSAFSDAHGLYGQSSEFTYTACVRAG